MDAQQEIERLQKQVEALKSENSLVWSRCADHNPAVATHGCAHWLR